MSTNIHLPGSPRGNGRGPSPDLWGDCPEKIFHPIYGRAYGYHDGDDFMGNPTLTGAYTATQATAGTFLQIDKRFGWASLDCDSTTQHQGINVQRSTGVGERWAPVASTKMWFEARVNFHDITGLTPNFFMGFHDIDTTILSSGILVDASNDWVGIKCETALATVLGTCGNNTTESVTGTLLTMSTTYDADVTTDGSTILKLGFRVTGTGLIEFYINGAKQASTITTNLPSALLVPSFVLQTDGTNDSIMNVDWWYAACEDSRYAQAIP